ncbi:MAG: antitoxin [Pseudonocardia sp.]
MGILDKAKEMLDQHDDKVNQALDKAGELAKGRFAGHDDRIDGLVDQAQQRTGTGDTTVAPPAEGEQPPPEVPAGSQQDVRTGPGHRTPQQ